MTTTPPSDHEQDASGSSTTKKPKLAVAGGSASLLLTQNEVLHAVTTDYLAEMATTGPLPPQEVERQLIARTNLHLKAQNDLRDPRDRFTALRQLAFSQVAQIMVARHRVVRIAPSGKNTDRDHDLLAVYVDAGEGEGTYATSEDHIRSIARCYDRQLTISGSKEVMTVLREEAPRVFHSLDPDMLAVNNGIFDYQNKTLLPFDSDLVFLAKSQIDYLPDPPCPVIADPDGDWDVESWMATLSEDEEIVELLWEILGAILRPHVHWGKSAWFYSESGNNGKGTLCELMRQLTGPNSYAAIPIADFGKDFMLEPLTRASSIIVDENDVGVFIDRAANLKAVVTNDVISINRKHKVPIAYQFYGFMVQCLNELPRIKDKSESFYRRQLFVPFETSFTGRERKSIKDDYLQRPEVLRYVLHRVLHMDYHALSEPEATKRVLAEYKEFNDPVRSFWQDFEQRFAWDLLPFGFLYDLYKAWFAATNPSGSPVGRNVFINDLVAIVRGSTEFYCSDKQAKLRPGARMVAPELMIADYALNDWKNPHYTGPDRAKVSTGTVLQASYRGLQRYVATAPQRNDDDKDTP